MLTRVVLRKSRPGIESSDQSLSLREEWAGCYVVQSFQYFPPLVHSPINGCVVEDPRTSMVHFLTTRALGRSHGSLARCLFLRGGVIQVIANRKTATQMLAEACGKPFDEVLQDSSRTFYMSPDEAVSYGLIDKVRPLATLSPIPDCHTWESELSSPNTGKLLVVAWIDGSTIVWGLLLYLALST